MKRIPPFPITAHRLARLTAWARLMLAWIGMMLFADKTPRMKRRRLRRHMLRRYPHLSLRPLARLVVRLIFLRAAGMAELRPRVKPWQVRDFTSAGFRRRLRPRQLMRVIIGSRLRAMLRHRDLRTRFARIVAALNNADAIAATLARRLKRGLSRLAAITAVRPPQHEVCCVGCGVPPATADTS